MSLLTERLLNAQYHNHEEDCCCGEECCCHDHEEKEIEQQLSEEEIEKIIEEKYSEKDEKTKEFIRKGLRKFGDRFDYSKTEYVKALDTVIIICRKHNLEFSQIACEHYRPSKYNACNPCPACQAEYKRDRFSKSQEDFIKGAISVHGDKYGYDKVDYINDHTDVEIYCRKCNKYFWQLPSNHLRGSGCPYCGQSQRIIKRTKSFQSFLEGAHKVHGDKYDYSKSEKDFVNRGSKIVIICKKHGEFIQEARDHLSGCGCPECGLERMANNNRYDGEKVLKELLEIAGDTLTFPDFNYTTMNSPITAKCISCGTEFKIRPDSIKRRPEAIHCPICCGIKHRLTTEEFIIRAKESHESSDYDYSETIYYDMDTPVKIYDCLLKEFFWQTPKSHLLGCGNPKRTRSKGSLWTEKWLIQNEIDYTSEYKVDIFSERGVRIDFRIMYKNQEFFIEFNGDQHYRMINHYHKTLEEFEHQLLRDKAIEEYCMSSNIKLIAIPYILTNYQVISEFLTKTIIENIDPHALIDYDSLYVIEEDNST